MISVFFIQMDQENDKPSSSRTCTIININLTVKKYISVIY